jgi:hypothetical protein
MRLLDQRKEYVISREKDIVLIVSNGVFVLLRMKSDCSYEYVKNYREVQIEQLINDWHELTEIWLKLITLINFCKESSQN